MNNLKTHTIILGAGIAGLWLLNRLNQQGYDSVLIDTADAGSGQTLSSQGIIHGGVKYSLNGSLSRSTTAIANMPQRWLTNLKGEGDIDLSHTEILSSNQLMWSANTLAAKTTAFFSSQAVSSKMKRLPNDQYPELFRTANFNGIIYQLHEPIINIHSLAKNLLAPWQDRSLTLASYNIQKHANGIYRLSTHDLILESQHLVLAAGEGNASILSQLNVDQPKMQARPLNMILAKGKLPSIYAHIIGANTKPLMTITSHLHKDGDTVWYLGGNIAEEGVGMNKESLLLKTKQLINELVPFPIDIGQLEWATYSVNRAEQQQGLLKRPDEACVHSQDNLHVIWPTKLALAPTVGDKLLSHYQQCSLKDSSHYKIDSFKIAEVSSKNPLVVAQPLWDRLFTS